MLNHLHHISLSIIATTSNESLVFWPAIVWIGLLLISGTFGYWYREKVKEWVSFISPNKLVAHYEKMILGPWYTTLGITLVGIFTGAWGSIYSSDIRNAFPFPSGWIICYPWEIFGLISYPALGFWVLLIVTGSFFLVREFAKETSRKRSENELISKANELKELIQTMPPELFMRELGKIIVEVDMEINNIFSNEPNRDAIENGVRYVLYSLVDLARKYDGSHSAGRYAANIMWFRSSQDLNPDDKSSIRERLHFVPHETSIDNLLGVLDIDNRLSTVSNPESVDQIFSPDSELAVLALPIPVSESKNDNWLVLPGAPFSFIKNEPYGFMPVDTLMSWCREKGDFPDYVIQDLASFVRDQEHVQALLAGPIRKQNQNSEVKPQILAILNIHSNQSEQMRCAGKGLQLFWEAVAPIRLVLEKLLTKLSDLPEAPH